MPVRTDRGSVRIIAGQWRSRRLPVVDVPGLRPSGDRSRETLFNWLQAYIPGTNCADLFAGTGALGFEAASRGAAAVAMVESNSRVLEHLQNNSELLGASQVSLHHGDALLWLEKQPPDSYGMLFVDPPFQDRRHELVLQKIEQSACLQTGGFVYLETPATQSQLKLPPRWSIWREKVLGEVRMQVMRVVR